MAILNNNPLIGSGGNQGYNINNSVRFRSSASGNLSRTPASAGNRQTWTLSVWVKRGNLGSQNVIFGAHPSDIAFMGFYSDNTFYYDVQPSTTRYRRTTAAVFRDPSAWYHVVFVADTTNATNTERLKVYINNVQYPFSTDLTATGYIPQNTQLNWNDNVIHRISAYGSGSALFFDGYLADFNFIDGQALTPSSFGETDTTTGVWKPKAYSGTYGTNGFYLKFSDIATTSGSNAGLGKDFSGNSNYWTTNNISVTSDTTYDAMTDSPTNTSATVANYCTLNPLSNLDATTLAAANLNFTQTTGSSSVFGTMGVSSGKYYWEVICQQGVMAGVADTQRSGGTYPGAFANSCAWDTFYTLNSTNTHATGTFTKAGTISGSAGTAGQVIGVALDMDAGTIVYYINGSVQNSGNAVFTNITGTVFPVFRGSTTTSSVNFGQRPFSYTPPTGFVALNTYNLPTSTIVKGNSYMDATLYTGTGSSLNVTGVNFQPDFVWIKERVGAADHGLYDAVRGVQKQLESNTTDAETTETTGLTAFNSNGFTVGALAQLNTNTDTYVGWSWKANGAGSSNTSGTITSTVSVNTTAGFSVVTYTGNGTAGATVGHGLGVSPAMTIIKSRLIAANSWCVWQKAFSTTQTLYLDSTTSLLTRDRMTGVSNTTFTIGSHTEVNTNASTYVAYCWAAIPGFSAFGSYTGNGSADGPMIFTGFQPKYILIKSTATANSWRIIDTTRNPYNTANSALWANESTAEATGSTHAIDILSNGFKIRNSTSETNNSGTTMIYAAFASNPFRNSNAF